MKEKLGIQRTFSKSKEAETWTVPIWVTLTISPLGNLTKIWIEEVMDLKKWREWTMWSVAPLSRIQSVEPICEVLTLEEKTEYSKDGEN